MVNGDNFDFTLSKEDEKWLNAISKYIDKCIKKYKEDLLDFENYLHAYPSLGLNHKIGKAIYKVIHRKELLPYYPLQNVYFRARKVVDDKVLNKKDFKSPPLGKSSSGRFNWIGKSSLYLSTTLEGACEEVCDNNKESLIWISRINFQKPSESILDLTIDPLNMEDGNGLLFTAILSLKLLNKNTEKKNGTWKPEYLMTNFIADCCKEANYEGVAYSSTRSPNVNIVLFNEDYNRIKVLDNPAVIKYKPLGVYGKISKLFD